MSVIVELSLPAGEFELGRILDMEGATNITLETLVPLGERPVPFFSVSDGARNTFEQQVRSHPGVDDLRTVNTHEGETLYALDWAVSTDAFFEGMLAAGANVQEARGSPDRWRFELRFPSHDRLEEFHEHCTEAGLSLDVEGIYNPTNPDAGPHFGLTSVFNPRTISLLSRRLPLISQ